MAEAKEVCKICYNSTSHKAVPTLTYEPKDEASDTPGGKKKLCTVCRQEWAPIRVAKELGSSRWVRIRPRPKLQMHIDFMICKNVNSRNDCPRGQDCSFAHSRAELWAWNQERQKEPRPAPTINGSYQYQMCKYMAKSGSCPYGSKCTFAHSDEELENWLKVQERSGNQYGQYRGGSGHYHSNAFKYRGGGRKQQEEHINSSKHRQYGGGGGAGYGGRASRASQQGANSRTSGRRPTRPRPTVAVVAGYRLCNHVQNGRRCLYGDYCTFAHSQMELDEWNQQIKEQNSHSRGASKSTSRESVQSVSSNKGASPPTTAKGASSQLLVDKDFSLAVRDRLARQHKDSGTIKGLEDSVEGVQVLEVSGRQLAVEVHSDEAVQWLFEVSSKGSHTLHSVVFLDSLTPHFSLGGVFKYGATGAWEQLSGREAGSTHGVGLQLNFRMSAGDKVRVKVNVSPRSGMLGQLVVFHVDSFCLVRCCVVHRVSLSQQQQLTATAPQRTSGTRRPDNVDLFWEQHYRTVSLESNIGMEETDKQLPEYLLPPQIEDFIKKGKYKNVENKVTKDNYRRRMHNLLYLEEFQQRVGLSRYDLYGVEIKPETSYSTPDGGTKYGQNGNRYFTVHMDEVLLEGGQTVRATDSALILPNNQEVAHECCVEHVGKETITLCMTDKAYQACAASRFTVSLHFVLGRVPMRAMHYAVDQLELDVIFPVVQSTPTDVIPTTDEVQTCLDVLHNSELNGRQVQAITSMLDPCCVQIPSLVLGPFGCGKTRTLCDSIKLLLEHMPKTRLLVCTHSNSAADIYVEKLHEWKSKGSPVEFDMLRVFYTKRRLATIPRVVQQYCLMDQNNLQLPTASAVKRYHVVVATLQTARSLILAGVKKGHFSHIFIDEAAQALESESIVPLCLAGPDTKIVLAGDHMQLDPPVYSDIARKYSLHLSLLERLFDAEAYNDDGLGDMCKTILTENHRSHQLIMDLPSQLFYKNKLTCKSIFPPGGPSSPPVKFVCVDGHEEQDEDSPSFYNKHEADRVVKEVQDLVAGGVDQREICVLAYYWKHISHIRQCLRSKGLGQVLVQTVENVQGRAFRALIISTVRTSASELVSEQEAGFLVNPKLFNTAVTRAKQWLVVVGDPVTLCTMGSNRLCWLEYIRRCISLKSFDHPYPSQFEDSLNYTTLTRQLLETTHSSFFRSGHRPVSRSDAPKELQQQTTTEVLKPGGQTVVKGVDPRVGVAQERKQEFVTRDAATAQRVALRGNMELNTDNKDKAKQVELSSLPSRPTDTRGRGSLAGRSHDVSRTSEVAPSGDVPSTLASRTNDVLHSRTQGALSSIAKELSSTKPQESLTSRLRDNLSLSKTLSPPALEEGSSKVLGSLRLQDTRSSKTEPSTLSNKKLLSPAMVVTAASLEGRETSSSSSKSSSPSKPANTTKEDSVDLNHVTKRSPPATDDLPPFLRGLLDNLQAYQEWCEGQLSASYPLRYSHRISQNLEKHRALLEKQLQMADDQVDLYRDLVSLLNQAIPYQRGNGGGEEPVGHGALSQGYVYSSANLSQGYGGPQGPSGNFSQGAFRGHQGALSQDVIALGSSGYVPIMGAPRMANHYQQLPLHQQQQQQQQLVFPSALPSSYPATFSGIGLQSSSFTTYDDNAEFIGGDGAPQ